MGITYNEFLEMGWLEFDYLNLGYQRRMQREWDQIRHLIASMFNSSGFAKKATKPKAVMFLDHLDNIEFAVNRIPDDRFKLMKKILLKNGGN